MRWRCSWRHHRQRLQLQRACEGCTTLRDDDNFDEGEGDEEGAQLHPISTTRGGAVPTFASSSSSSSSQHRDGVSPQSFVGSTRRGVGGRCREAPRRRATCLAATSSGMVGEGIKQGVGRARRVSERMNVGKPEMKILKGGKKAAWMHAMVPLK